MNHALYATVTGMLLLSLIVGFISSSVLNDKDDTAGFWLGFIPLLIAIGMAIKMSYHIVSLIAQNL